MKFGFTTSPETSGAPKLSRPGKSRFLTPVVGRPGWGLICCYQMFHDAG